MGVYLEEHPPARRQYRNPRRAQVTGAIVAHTAESSTDLVLPDMGAEGVARYIATRSDPGSYHSVVDSDSIVRVGRYEWEMFHEGTGGNRWSLGLSFACRAAQWPTLPERWRVAALRNGAREAANMARWVHAETGITVPARRITAAEYRAGRPGFVGHGELDPGRRTDPGPGFRWIDFLAYYSAEMIGETMADPQVAEWAAAIANPTYYANLWDLQNVLKAHAGYEGALDRLPGPLTKEAWHRLKNSRDLWRDKHDKLEDLLVAAEQRIAELEARQQDDEGTINELHEQVEGLQQDLAGCQADLDAAVLAEGVNWANVRALLDRLDEEVGHPDD